ncbi:MAG: hypothetical protein IJ766_03355 [Clostridia bacterium]|nr:hypothetical protein [Clostridia bacterium]
MLEKINYKHNKPLETTLPAGMINGQGAGAIKNFRYGICSFGWCGCEIIGAYNLLQMVGKPAPMCEIAREIYPYGQVLCGFFGTNVYTLAHYFKKHKIPVKTIYRKDAFFREAPQGKYGVVSFWTGKVLRSSIHTVAYRVREDGKIVIYNKYNSRNYEYVHDDMNAAFGRYTFIVANIL